VFVLAFRKLRYQLRPVRLERLPELREEEKAAMMEALRVAGRVCGTRRRGKERDELLCVVTVKTRTKDGYRRERESGEKGNVHDESSKVWLFPVGEVVEEVEKDGGVEVASGGELEEVVWIGEGLDGLYSHHHPRAGCQCICKLSATEERKQGAPRVRAQT
jgi:hypothetical protein